MITAETFQLNTVLGVKPANATWCMYIQSIKGGEPKRISHYHQSFKQRLVQILYFKQL